MKLRIEFPEDIAKERIEEAKEWESAHEDLKKASGKEQPLVWEAEEYHAPEKIKRIGNEVVLETEYTKVILHSDEVKKILKLFEK
jgi:hypothetical protein